MKDLYRCLEDQPAELVQAVAAAWQVVLPEGDSHALALRLGDAMLQAGALERVLAGLSPLARAALDDLVRAGGAAPTQRLAPTYGEIRRFGPARLAREQPWQQPASPLEELYFAGLVDRAYLAVGAHTGPALLVPNQLYARLVPWAAATPAPELAPCDPPSEPLDDGDALVEDLFALLVAVRQGGVRAPALPGDRHVPRPWPRLELGTRLQGEQDPVRLALVAEMAARLGLTRQAEGWLRPGPRAREWLHLSDVRRQRSVLVAWRDDPRWNELAYVPTLRCDGEVNLSAARRALLLALADCPAGRWLALESLLALVKRRYPDYLRPEGDAAWRARDAVTGEPLSGAAVWDRVEGVLAKHMLTTSLRWLGVLATGREAGTDEPLAVCITARGQALLHGTLAEAAVDPGDGSSALDKEEPAQPLATIADDLSIRLPLANSLHERYQLERFATWESQDSAATYRVTADSLWRGHNGGVEVAQVVRFITRISGDRVPAPAMRTLLAWGGRLGHVRLREMLLLQTDNERTMKQITSRAELRALLGAVLSPTTCLVERNKADRLLAELKALGLWPKLES